MKIIQILFIVYFQIGPLFAQDINILDYFEKSFEVVNDKYSKGRYKGQVLKGHRNGMGFVLSKEKFLYAGDFYRGDISGLGVLVEPDGIEGCKGCITYVGNWEKGIKSGYGRCYNESGCLIYQGNFSDNMPQGTYPSTGLDTLKKFMTIELDDNVYYMGETYDGNANGMGMIIFNDGSMWQSHFKDGMLNGIGLYCAYNGDWQTRNVKGSEYVVVTTSDEYKINDAVRKENAVLSWSAMTDALDKLALTTQALSNTSSMNNQHEGTSLDKNIGSAITCETSSASPSTGSKKSKSQLLDKKNNLSEQQHYNSDKRVWANYDSYLAAHFYGGREATLNSVREWQKAMRDLRAKWKAKGKSFPVSSNENKSTANCINKLHSH